MANRGPRPDRGERRSITVQPGAQLPRWVRDEVVRSTPKDRREAALHELTKGLHEYAAGRFGQAAGALGRAKDLAPRAATIREMLGLSLYETGQWSRSLQELRTYRRLTGDTDHMANELDCLRALKRHRDIEKTYNSFFELGGGRDSEDEVRVVYASHLLDEGDANRAWQVIKPGRLVSNPPEPALRRWAVAARVAKAAGDSKTARQLLAAIRSNAGEIPWLADLEHQLQLD